MQFLNYGNNTSRLEVNYPLVYVHGIVSSEGAKFIEVNQQKWPIIQNEWKIFAFVTEGENRFIFKCENEVKEVIIEYTKNVNKRFILPVYIICQNSDGSFIAPDNNSCNSMEVAVQKIKLNVRLIQTYFAESLHEYGLERKTFFVSEDLSGEPEVFIFASSFDTKDIMGMKPGDLYKHFHQELAEKLPHNPYCKYLCFMSCTRYFPPPGQVSFTTDEMMSYVRGHAALGGGNMALFGTGSFHTWASKLEELIERFSDNTVIDRTKLFDDSCGRGTHWANYSTTLGATVHELGHCFDLAHTKHGIMSRGHDDMNCFYTVVQSSKQELSLIQNSELSPIPTKKVCLQAHVNGECEGKVGNQFIQLDDTGQYKGAHWYRSSAILLKHHKWFNCYNDEEEECASKPVVVSLHPDLLGPVGNMGTSAQPNQTRFNSIQWLRDNNLTTIVGVVFYFDDYLQALQFHAIKMVDESYECEGDVSISPVYGTPSQSHKKIVFPIDAPYEEITSIRLRSGAWIDGIQLTTNLKSSRWIGGKGGDVTRFEIKDGRSIVSWIGSAGEYVGSLAFLLGSINDKDEVKSTSDIVDNSFNTVISVCSPDGLRLVECYDNNNGEVCYFKDFSEDPPPLSVQLDLKEVGKDPNQTISGRAWDDRGNKVDFMFDQTVFDILKFIK